MLETFQPFVVPGTARYHGGKRSPSAIDTIVMHTTAGESADSSISWLNRVVKAGESVGSYHYIISSDRRIIRMLAPIYVAYHAGVSAIPPTTPRWPMSVNKRSIGISFDTLDTPRDPLTDWQIDAALWLCRLFCYQYNIHADHIFGHREVAPGRKVDPQPFTLDMEQWRRKVAASL